MSAAQQITHRMQLLQQIQAQNRAPADIKMHIGQNEEEKHQAGL